jgi:hypothetical protein
LGLEAGRLRLVWASAAEGARFAGEVSSFVEQIRALGPLHWGKPEDAKIDPVEVPEKPQLQEVAA